MPGTAQAKLDNKGIKARPLKPALNINLSNRKAARGKYPDSSNTKMKKNRIKICGKNTTTPPAPAMTPSTTKLFKSGCEICCPINSPNQPKNVSIPSINGAAQAKTAWKTTNIMTARLTSPKTGCKKILSKKSERLSSSSTELTTSCKIVSIL